MPHERKVTRVQRAHRGHKADAFARIAEAPDCFPECSDGSGEGNATWYHATGFPCACALR